MKVEETQVVSFNRKKPMKPRRVAFILACCVLPVLNFLVFYVYVNFSAFFMAFTNKDGVFTLENFVRLWNELRTEDSEISIALRNTLITFVINLLRYPPSVLVSYFLYKKIPGSSLYRILFFVPKMLFDVAETMIIIRLLSPQGFIAQGLKDMLDLSYVPELLADSQFANLTIFAHFLWAGFAGNLIIWGGTFARIPVELSESCRVDGATWWQEFTKVTIPLVWPQVALDLVFGFVGLFSASGAVFLFTKGQYGTMTLSCWLYLKTYNVTAGVGSTNAFNYMSAVGLVMTVISVAISLYVRKITDAKFSGVEY